MALVESADTSSSRHELGVFAAQPEEHDYLVAEIQGSLPDGLRGTFYRVGPGTYESGGSPLAHIFDGDGMVSAFQLRGDGIRFRSRYVRTPNYLAGLRRRGPAGRTIGTNRRGGWFGNVGRRPANVANTNTIVHHGQLYALYEMAKPYRLDPDTLATVDEEDFDGRIPRLGTFSAHFKIDPATGDLWNFGMDAAPVPMLRCYRLDRAGRLHNVRSIRLPQASVNHDFALTERHMVFALDPGFVTRAATLRFLALGRRMADIVQWRPERGTTIVLVPRDGTTPHMIETDAFFHFHVNNAFEDHGDTVLDLVRWNAGWDELLPHFDAFRTTDGSTVTTSLTRLRISHAGRVRTEPLYDRSCEFPQHDWRRTTRPHRYTYGTTGFDPRVSGGVNALTKAHAIAKIDHYTGTASHHVLPDGHVVSEAVFVPRTSDSAEDDGWLLAVAYDPAQHRSRLVVLDARDPARDPVCTAHLHHHVPFGFHGTFASVSA